MRPCHASSIRDQEPDSFRLLESKGALLYNRPVGLKMLFEYTGILITFGIAGLVAGLFLFLATVLGPKKPSASKDSPFECGEEPFQLPTGRANVKFYIIAMLFVLFDLEIVFFFPWAVLLRKLGVFGLFEMGTFLAVLVAAYAYAWRKGALDWQ